jgi:hypothetical protein
MIRNGEGLETVLDVATNRDSQHGLTSRHSTSHRGKQFPSFTGNIRLLGNVFSEPVYMAYPFWIPLYTAVHTAFASPERNLFSYRELPNTTRVAIRLQL